MAPMSAGNASLQLLRPAVADIRLDLCYRGRLPDQKRDRARSVCDPEVTSVCGSDGEAIGVGLPQ